LDVFDFGSDGGVIAMDVFQAGKNVSDFLDTIELNEPCF
jgi:hypothetical protein